MYQSNNSFGISTAVKQKLLEQSRAGLGCFWALYLIFFVGNLFVEDQGPYVLYRR